MTFSAENPRLSGRRVGSELPGDALKVSPGETLPLFAQVSGGSLQDEAATRKQVRDGRGHASPAHPQPAGIQPLARRSDPQTSKDAAKSAADFASSHCGIILSALKKYGPAGKTRLAARTQISDVAVARRLADLQKQGLAEPTGETEINGKNRQERIWRAL